MKRNETKFDKIQNETVHLPVSKFSKTALNDRETGKLNPSVDVSNPNAIPVMLGLPEGTLNRHKQRQSRGRSKDFDALVVGALAVHDCGKLFNSLINVDKLNQCVFW
jgi:hypothetical protein